MNKKNLLLVVGIIFASPSFGQKESIELPEFFFKSGSTEYSDKALITEPMKDTIDRLNFIVRILNENPIYIVNINGHSDVCETKGKDTILGYKRTEKIKQYLISKNISSKRLILKSYGTSRPIISSKELKKYKGEEREAALEYNRRATFSITIK